MTIIYAAATAVVNPPGIQPVISQNQLWEALELKRKQPELFLAVIDTCKVLENKNEVILREATFKDGGGKFAAPVLGRKVQERITYHAPISPTAGSGVEMFDVVGSASRVLNIVSTGTKPGELFLTFTFEWDHPEVKKGSKEELEKQRQYQAGAPPGIARTLDKIREMVSRGKLGDEMSMMTLNGSENGRGR